VCVADDDVVLDTHTIEEIFDDTTKWMDTPDNSPP
jgi:hypothetical protein